MMLNIEMLDQRVICFKCCLLPDGDIIAENFYCITVKKSKSFLLIASIFKKASLNKKMLRGWCLHYFVYWKSWKNLKVVWNKFQIHTLIGGTVLHIIVLKVPGWARFLRKTTQDQKCWLKRNFCKDVCWYSV